MKFKLLIATILTSSFFVFFIDLFFARAVPCLLWRKISIINSNLIKGFTKAQFFFGLYESAELRFISKYLPPHSVVVELGSSMGVVASFVANYLTHKRLVLVEANPTLIPLIQQNLLLNQVSNFSIFNLAITDRSTKLWFTPGSDTISGGITHEAKNDSELVEGIKLAELLDRAGVDDCVLISDIEGAEVSFILDGNGLKKCSMLVIELHEVDFNGRSYNPKDMVALLVSTHGFNLIDQYGNVAVFARSKQLAEFDLSDTNFEDERDRFLI